MVLTVSFIVGREEEEVNLFLRVNMRTPDPFLTFVYAGESNAIFQRNSISALGVINCSSNEPEPAVSET